jgi:hypothetical protein
MQLHCLSSQCSLSETLSCLMFKKRPTETKTYNDKETLVESLLYLLADRIGFFRNVKNFINREITGRLRRIAAGVIFLAIALGFFFSGAVAMNFFIYYLLYNFTNSILISVLGLLAVNILLGLLSLLAAFHWFAKAGRSVIKKNIRY